MKKLLLLLLCLPLIGFGQSVLFSYEESCTVIATKDPNNTIGIKVNSLIERKILLNRPKEIFVTIPFFNTFLIKPCFFQF